MKNQLHDFFMQQALNMAETARFRTRPNPAVGCVIVKDGEIVGRGATAPVGGSHAEVYALKDAGDKAHGATAYVTLEPCAHYGRTPPCANALVKAGIKQVIIATLDPNPLVAGKGVQILHDAGIITEIGILEQQAIAQNQGFLKVMAGGLPYIRLKIATSLDGRTAMASGESKWITGEFSRQDVQFWRASSAAVMTGIDTILADDALLNVRSLYGKPLSELDIDVVQPYRIILDRQGRLPLDAKILNPEHSEIKKVIVMTPFRQELADKDVIQLDVMPLDELLLTLKKDFQIYDILLECGATLATAFLQHQLVDEVLQYVAPMYLGQDARALNQLHLDTLSQALHFDVLEIQQLERDIRLRLKPIY
ncbi:MULTISPECIES: bifunctional diaminohydroxyphosphoribosylaminopyrimidine deaminase/5-amino-6-(5-phosphoribosylamino)uracil reductase RibD [unclassified Acinetobacter]|uniref:bifunctional diaminohydroxyphosphoribosylaminopyrimidine deaminase/5-amino-6-(5-phosphoribosylamino)uracil reductase RibD n=1 Tax=unclassified Acinetobacter TaxID=196816 RepID=UPI0035BADE31